VYLCLSAPKASPSPARPPPRFRGSAHPARPVGEGRLFRLTGVHLF
jgi:hypothetical protein